MPVEHIFYPLAFETKHNLVTIMRIRIFSQGAINRLLSLTFPTVGKVIILDSKDLLTGNQLLEA